MSKLSKLVVCLSIILNMLASCCFVAYAANKQDNSKAAQGYYMGCEQATPEQINSFPKAPKVYAPSLPPLVDLSGNFAVPGSQGQQNSCTAWSTVYAYKTFQEKLDHQWSVDTKDHQFSPAYVYNQLNGGANRGIAIHTALKLMVDQGVCSLADMPYSASDYLSKPNAKQKAAAAAYKAASWGVIDRGDIDSMKQHIANGDAVVVGIPIYDQFNRISQANPIYNDDSGKLSGYHAICLVGYDEAKGAFKFINSWGRNWGLGGYGYISYNIIRKHNIEGYTMVDKREAAPNPTPNPTPTPRPTPTPNPTPNPNPVRLLPANISVGTTNAYTLNIAVPANSPATSLVVYANNNPVKTITLTPNSPQAKTIILRSTNSAAGTFTYRCELKSPSGSVSTENLAITLQQQNKYAGGNVETYNM